MAAISAERAVALILDAVTPQPALRLRLPEAIGHVLAEDVIAPIPLPPWTNASMDGYAVRADEIRGASPEHPRVLRVAGVVAAGHDAPPPIATGVAWRIATGAPVPPGADTVVRQEDTDRGTIAVRVQNDRDAGMNLRAVGSDLAVGAVALEAGTPIGPRQLALLAALGVAHPVVHRRPRVGVLSLGDEVVPFDDAEAILARKRLGDVNGPALAALTNETGGVPVPLGIVGDEIDALAEAIRASGDTDMIISAGGASVGERDHIARAMERCGVDVRFDRVAIRPGGPVRFGVLPDGRPWLALPGNPVSAMVTFDLFAQPAIRRMSGHRVASRPRSKAQLGSAVAPDRKLELYLRCTFADGGATAVIAEKQGSGMLATLAHSEGLAVIPPGTTPLPAGAMIDVIPFDRP